ncbi:MAG: hypothetical protein EOO04_25025 [Chitinophagaceae bacterium]|nr:MAG: hypothetical protein EOO04_25025 [Chitinophagaceae bacterium]
MTAKKLWLIVTCICTVLTNISAKTYKVSSREQCEAAVRQLKAGDEIILGNGEYANWEILIGTNGTAAKPIVIKAASPGKAIFQGEINKPVFTITGSYIRLEGLSFINCRQVKANGGNGIIVELKSSKFCRITDCSFQNNSTINQFTPMVSVSGKGENNRLDHCRFSVNTDNQEVQVKITDKETPEYTMIDHNEFSNKPPVSWQNANGGECIQIGQDPVLLGIKESYTTVRDNRFFACDGEPEVISNKSSGNRYINNYFDKCRGELVMRGGHDCLIDSNTIRNGSGGIRVNGTNHTITNNKLTGMATGIRLMYGMTGGKTEVGFYVAASNCTISSNEIADCKTGIYIGGSKNTDWTGKFDTKRYPSRTMQDVPPSNNIINGNRITNTETMIFHNETAD